EMSFFSTSVPVQLKAGGLETSGRLETTPLDPLRMRRPIQSDQGKIPEIRRFRRLSRSGRLHIRQSAGDNHNQLGGIYPKVATDEDLVRS
ncbi:MAG: hypothetical protein ACU0C9_04995, partial [Paracoccaceae bacterium]